MKVPRKESGGGAGLETIQFFWLATGALEEDPVMQHQHVLIQARL
jgi:hypothetical protein